jgi:GNAT superfamily N-acetyltransferase
VKTVIKDVIESDFSDIPEPCRSCLYWSFPQEFEWAKREASRYKQRFEAKKKQWIIQTLKKFGNCGKILYCDNVPVGYAEFGPSSCFPQIREYKSQPIGKIEDGVVFLSCLFVADKNLRGKGLGEKLLDSIIAELKRRGFEAVETYALKGSPNNPSGPVELYLKRGFHIKDKTNPEFPIVRLNL